MVDCARSADRRRRFARQSNLKIRFGAEKYAKFAYSTRYAFSIEHALRGIRAGAFGQHDRFCGRTRQLEDARTL